MIQPRNPTRPPAYTDPAPATQTQHPWRATIRTVFAALVGLLPLLPFVAADLGIAAVGWVAGVLAVAGGVTRLLARPQVEAWLREHGLISAQPRQP